MKRGSGVAGPPSASPPGRVHLTRDRPPVPMKSSPRSRTRQDPAGERGVEAVRVAVPVPGLGHELPDPLGGVAQRISGGDLAAVPAAADPRRRQVQGPGRTDPDARLGVAEEVAAGTVVARALSRARPGGRGWRSSRARPNRSGSSRRRRRRHDQGEERGAGGRRQRRLGLHGRLLLRVRPRRAAGGRHGCQAGRGTPTPTSMSATRPLRANSSVLVAGDNPSPSCRVEEPSAYVTRRCAGPPLRVYTIGTWQ